VLSHPPYSPDLVPADFLLFPKLKIVMKGMRFEAVSFIQQTVAIWEETLSDGINKYFLFFCGVFYGLSSGT
jgi:hypothetical protein